MPTVTGPDDMPNPSNRQLLADLMIKGFLPLGMVCGAGYIFYLQLHASQQLVDRLFDEMLQQVILVREKVDNQAKEIRGLKVVLQKQSTPNRE